MRQIKILKILLFCIMLYAGICATGCGTSKPAYCSDFEINEMVLERYGDDIRFISKVSDQINIYEDTSYEAEYVDRYIYTFETADGMQFTVKSWSTPKLYLGNPTSFYEPMVYCDYEDQVINLHEAHILELFQEYDVTLLYNDAISRHNATINIGSKDNICKISKMIADIDKKLAFNCNYSETEQSDLPAELRVYYTDNEEEIYLCDFKFSSNEKNRWTEGSVKSFLEDSLEKHKEE